MGTTLTRAPSSHGRRHGVHHDEFAKSIASSLAASRGPENEEALLMDAALVGERMCHSTLRLAQYFGLPPLINAAANKMVESMWPIFGRRP